MAVQTYYWIGVTDGDWEVATNWDGTDAYYPGYGQAGDKVFFTYDADHYPDTNLDRKTRVGATAAVSYDFGILAISDDYEGTIGASATPLICGATTVRVDALRAGNIYLEGADSSLKLDDIYVTNAPAANTLFLAGLMVNLYVYKGNVEIVSGAAIATSFEVGLRDALSDANVTIRDTTGSATTLPACPRIYGGTIENYSGFGTMEMVNATWTQGKDNENSNVCGNSTGTIRQFGGTFRWNRGSLNNYYCHAGLMDASRGKSARAAAAMYVHSGIANLVNGMGNVTGSFYLKGPGRIITPAGTTITLS